MVAKFVVAMSTVVSPTGAFEAQERELARERARALAEAGYRQE